MLNRKNTVDLLNQVSHHNFLPGTRGDQSYALLEAIYSAADEEVKRILSDRPDLRERFKVIQDVQIRYNTEIRQWRDMIEGLTQVLDPSPPVREGLEPMVSDSACGATRSPK